MLDLYAAFAYQLGPAQIAVLATGANIINLPIAFTAGWMMDRFGRKRTMVPGFGGVALTMAALAVCAFIPLAYAWYVGLFFLAIAAQALTGSSIQTVGADVAPPEARGIFLGVWRLTGQGGATLSPILFAVIAETLGYGSSFVFVAALGRGGDDAAGVLCAGDKDEGVRRNAPTVDPAAPFVFLLRPPVTA